MKRSPWFNAQAQPPINGGPDAMYEHRCRSFNHWFDWRKPSRMSASSITKFACDMCQWRGLLREKAK